MDAGENYCEEGYLVKVTLGYDTLNEFEHICNQNDMRIIEREYLDKVKLLVEVEKQKYDKILQKNLKNNFQKFTIKIEKEKHIKVNKILEK